MTRPNFSLFLATLAFILIATTKVPLIKSLNYNQDEIDYTGNSLLWSEYKINYDRQLWSLPWAYDQPHLYHYILGILVKEQTLLSLGYNQRGDDWRQFMVEWNQQCLGNYYNNQQPRCNIINQVRLLPFSFYLLDFILLALITYKLIGKLGLLTTIIFFYLNQNLDNNLITAVSDSLLLFFVLLFIYLLLTKKPQPILVLSVISGLALSTKINGGILILISNILILSYKKLPSIKKILLVNIIPWIIFVILNPYLWQQTFYHTYKMVSYRFTVNEVFPYILTSESPPNNFLFDRIFFNAKRLMSFDHPSNWSAILFIFIFIISSYLLAGKKLSLQKQNLLAISLLLQLITLSYISIYWSRYYIPAQIGLYLNIISLMSIYKDKLSSTK